MNRVSSNFHGNRPISTNNDDNRLHDNRTVSVMMGGSKNNPMENRETMLHMKTMGYEENKMPSIPLPPGGMMKPQPLPPGAMGIPPPPLAGGAMMMPPPPLPPGGSILPIP